jgi:hypothetical protein
MRCVRISACVQLIDHGANSSMNLTWTLLTFAKTLMSNLIMILTKKDNAGYCAHSVTTLTFWSAG